jgi:signal transduction histidine kinase
MRLPAIFRTSVFQLTILYVVLFGVSVVTLGWFIYFSTVGFLQRQTQEVIEAEVGGLLEQVRLGVGPDTIKGVISDRIHQSGEERSYYLLVSPRREIVAGNLPYWDPAFEGVDKWVEFTFEQPDGEIVPVLGLVTRIKDFGLFVGRETSELEQLKHNFQRASILGLGITMTLAFVGGLALAFGSQRRIAELNRTTRRIIAGDMTQRVPVEGGHDEHAELAQSVNTMLDQIESLMAGLRHVGDSIAHDLRGPLTRLRTRLEQLADEEAPSHESVEECLAQADGVLSTFNALLRIARVETGAYRSAFATIDLGQIASDVADLYQATADEQLVEIRRRIIDQALVFGDRELLAQALTNLLDNALKYTPAGGHIDMEVKRRSDRIVVVVADTGPGVPPESREKVLERFARLDESRSKPGNGLGLALVRAVSDQHDGELRLTDNGPGLRVTLSLPAAKLASPADEPRPQAQASG